MARRSVCRFAMGPHSTVREPELGRPLAICVAVVLAAIAVFVLCKSRQTRRMGCTACSARAARADHPGTAVEARDASHLREVLAAEPRTCVLFFAPWCGHCRETKPAFEAAAARVPEAVFVLADCERDGSIATEHGLEGYPTVRCFRHGTVTGEYAGDRTADGLARWAQGA